MNILITGANGFIGMALSKQLSELGHSVIKVVRRSGCIADGVVLQDDDSEAWLKLMSNCDVIVHLSGRSMLSRKEGRDAWNILYGANVVYTSRLVERALVAGIKRIVFVSSIKVNGESTALHDYFSAEDMPRPQDLYARSKLEAEKILLNAASKSHLEVVIIRPPLVYGLGVKGNFRSLINLVKSKMPLPFASRAKTWI